MAGGILLVVMGGLLLLGLLLGLVSAAAMGDVPGGAVWVLAFGMVGAAQLWVGILAIRQRVLGRILGIVIGLLGLAFSLIGLVASLSAREEAAVDGIEPAVVVSSIFCALMYGTAVLLFGLGRPHDVTESRIASNLGRRELNDRELLELAEKHGIQGPHETTWDELANAVAEAQADEKRRGR